MHDGRGEWLVINALHVMDSINKRMESNVHLGRATVPRSSLRLSIINQLWMVLPHGAGWKMEMERGWRC